MTRKATVLALFLLAVQPVLILVTLTPAHADGGDGVLGHLYAGTGEPAMVYRYVGGTDWQAISPLPRSRRTRPGRPASTPRRDVDSGFRTPLGKAVLDLTHYEGHLYAGTISNAGTGQVWRHDGGTAWTLVGDDLDDRVTFLRTYQGRLYAATGACGRRVYAYTPTSAAQPSTQWELQADHHGLFGGTYGDQLHALAAASCIHTYVERHGEAYLVTDDGMVRRPSEEAGWKPTFVLGNARIQEMEVLGEQLYIGHDNGELRVTDGDAWPGELVFAAPQPIRSLTTDQRALYVGTGDRSAQQVASGSAYRLDDGSHVPKRISGALGASIEVLYTVAPSGLDLSKLERGDILLARGPGRVNGPIGFVATYLGGSYWIHGGMYAGEETIVESSSAVTDDFGMVRITNITETLFWEEDHYWAAIRVTQPDAREGATGYAESQEGDLYNVDYPFWGLPVKQLCLLLGPFIGIDPAVCCSHPVTDRETEDDCFYCTHLPWRAYHTQGVDLDSDAAWPARLFATQAIPGDDLYYDDDVILVDERSGMQAVVISAVGSPADMLVIDPQGRRTGADPDTGEPLDEIPNVTYGGIDLPPVLDFFLPDKWESDFVAIPDLEDTWEIRIIGTKAGDYTLGAELVDWQNHRTQTFTQTTDAGRIDAFKIEYPKEPGGPIISTSDIYLPLVIRML